MVPLVFRNSDVDAPALTGEPGSLIAVMKHCLLQAGWSLEWEDTVNHKAVLRNSIADGGAGCYLRIDDSSALYGRMNVYEDMTDIDTGINPATSMDPGVVVLKSVTSSPTARAYVVFADSRTFYGCVRADGSGFPTGTFASASAAVPTHTAFGGGDYDAWQAGEMGVFVAGRLGTGTGHYVVSGMGRVGSSTESFSLARSTSMLASPNPAVLARMKSFAGTEYPADGISASPHTLGIGGAIDADDIAIPAFVVSDPGGLRGRMRGLYVPLGRRNDVRTASQTVHVTLGKMATREFGVIRGYPDTGTGNHINTSWYLFVDLGDWDA